MTDPGSPPASWASHHDEVEPGAPGGRCCWVLDPKKEHAQGQRDDYWGEGNVLSRGIHGQASIETAGKAYVALGDYVAVQGCPGG